VSRPRAADDFPTIRARMEQLRRERAPSATNGNDPLPRAMPLDTANSNGECRRRARIEGLPPPWVPTIFARRPR
jgi:hypothetical protein